ncbi:unnamed protein product [Tilletia controversa]|nr:unnamed protein product [Tilletia controversa]
MLTAVIAAAAGVVITSESTSRSHTADNTIPPSQLLNLADFKSIFCLPTTAAIEQRWASLLGIRRAHTHHLTPQHLKRYARCRAKQECPLAGLWGFVDGTVCSIARPVRGQRQYYSGHKRVHGIKFQVVIAGDGLLWIHGPREGRRNDSFMLADSGLHDWLDEHSMDEKGKDLFLFADKAYGPRGHLVIPYKGLFVTKEQKQFNIASP